MMSHPPLQERAVPRASSSLLLSLLLLAACGDEGGVDADGDGAAAGVDCDDSDPSIHPDAEDICDGVDNDCDGVPDDSPDRVFYQDSDGDGFGDPDSPLTSCEPLSGFVEDRTDCDDRADAAYPGGAEVCDGLDNDCDGTVDGADAADALTFYEDSDGDGYGALERTARACALPAGYAEVPGDCDDTDAGLNPNTLWYRDGDEDGYGNGGMLTQNCEQPVGYADNPDDCDDSNPASHPGALEYCDDIDSDCDTALDDPDAVDTAPFYADSDGDGYGDPDSALAACAPPEGYVDDAQDCDDADAEISPDALERCADSVDNDCDGTVDQICAYLAGADYSAIIEGDGGDFGHRLDLRGDLDGDGVVDVVVTASSYDSVASNGGRAYVFFGPLSSGGRVDDERRGRHGVLGVQRGLPGHRRGRRRGHRRRRLRRSRRRGVRGRRRGLGRGGGVGVLRPAEQRGTRSMRTTATPA